MCDCTTKECEMLHADYHHWLRPYPAGVYPLGRDSTGDGIPTKTTTSDTDEWIFVQVGIPKELEDGIKAMENGMVFPLCFDDENNNGENEMGVYDPKKGEYNYNGKVYKVYLGKELNQDIADLLCNIESFTDEGLQRAFIDMIVRENEIMKKALNVR